jgi:hypothetical protein
MPQVLRSFVLGVPALQGFRADVQHRKYKMLLSMEFLDARRRGLFWAAEPPSEWPPRIRAEHEAGRLVVSDEM